MASPFDDIFSDADQVLFEVFGEQDPARYFGSGDPHGLPVKVVVHRNLQMVGAGGNFEVVQLAVDLQKSDIPAPVRNATLQLNCKRYVLELKLMEDSTLTRYSLNPLD